MYRDGNLVSMTDLLLMPGMLTAFGVMMFALMTYSERNNRRPNKWKWVAYIPLVLAAWMAWNNWLWPMINPSDGFIYRENIVQRRFIAGHWAAFGIPAASILIIGIVQFIQRGKWDTERFLP
jgi:hypothetical protein